VSQIMLLHSPASYRLGFCL